MRHEKLHARTENARFASSPSALVTKPVTPESLHNSDAGDGNDPSLAGGPSSDQGHNDQDAAAAATIQNMTPLSDLDFELIWPDSEDLFQTIMSSDVSSQWQLPLATLPFPPESYSSRNVSIGSPSSFDDRAPSIGIIPSGGNHQAVHDVSEMIVSLSSSVTAAAGSTSITSVFLDECLHMFFVRFIPTFPVLHRQTFVFRECTHPLLLNAIAIGSLYLGPKDAVAKGEALWRLAHTAVATSWQTLMTHRGPYDACQGVQLVITSLLGQVYGALSKNRAIRTTSQAFRALGLFCASHCGMFNCEPFSASSLLSSNASKAEKDHQWRVWASSEIQRRALLAHYMLDGLIAHMSGEPTSVRHASNQLGLPSSEAAFEAATADEWLSHLHTESADQSSFRSIFRILFSPVDDARWLGYTFSAFSFRVLLEGLQSLVSDCDENGNAAVGVPTKAEIRRALARVYESIARELSLPTSDRLETYLRWHAICLDAMKNSSLMCKYVCNRYNVDQHIWANGKVTKPEPDLIRWANTDDGRRALLHAVAIQDIIEQLPRGRAHAIHMPSSLFAAATVYSVFSLAGIVTVKLPSAIDWKDVLSTIDDPSMNLAELSGAAIDSDTVRYIRGEYNHDFCPSGATRNLLYEFNSIQKLFGCLSTQWGVSSDMEEVVSQWISLCH